MSGRETSVSVTFHSQLFKACLAHGSIELNIPLSGADRYFNADHMFSSNEQFFLIEFKSRLGNLGSEDNKLSACMLCEGLFECDHAADLHRLCHFAMWGKKSYLAGLETFYGVYQDLVCRPNILPSCAAVQDMTLPDWPPEVIDELIRSGPELAEAVALQRLGLEKHNFLIYLAWLLGTRKGDNKKRELPITLYGISFAGGIESKAFHSFVEFEQWVAPVFTNPNATATPTVTKRPKPDSGGFTP